ncbi:MAG: DUF2953 domain-containing protein [Clostridiales bacterium]|nr:DUF2953 domain-containing protein [Clostridiales bacterium]
MIVFEILKVLALILVYVLAAVLIIITLALFSPARYRLRAGYDGKNEIFLKAAWLFHIFSVIYDTNASPAFKFNIFGRARKRKRKPADTERGYDNESNIKKREELKENNNEEKSEENEEDEEKQSLIDKFNKWKGYWDKFLEYPYKSGLTEKTLLFLKRVLKAILPDRADGECRFGFEDPSLTGMLLGLAHAVRGRAGLYEHVRISADFEKKYLYLKCRASGKIRLWALLWPFLAYVLSKPVWIIIKPHIFKNKKKAKG